uniref:Lcc2 protein n=1 Tax=Hericium coralloides TaxID=100756 RepID=A0A0C6E5U8_HERCO|nr:laccase [Hericium coralloides]
MLLSKILSPLVSVIGARMTLAAIGPVTDLHIVNTQLAPDGFLRDTVVAEGIFPGPTISGNKGDNFQINVINELTDTSMLTSTTIHWHGLFQHGTNQMDGVAFVTQCPIPPNDSFLYNFSVPDQAGTFWYHSHLSTQYCDGLRGPLVIYDPNDPHKNLYDVDDDSTIITLADWYHIPAPEAGLVPPFNATLINGLGRAGNGSSSPLAVVSVTAGQRYRMRLINIACDPNYIFTIDNHTFTIIEVDGVSVQPYDVDSIQVYASQRYSFILNANQTVGNYWIRAMPNAGVTTFTGGINMAILRYAGAGSVEPNTVQTPSIAPMQETVLRPLVAKPAPGLAQPGGADINIQLQVAFTGTEFTVNGQPWVSPSVPVLLQILSGAQKASDLLPSGSIYGLDLNKSVEINIPGGVVAGGHPVHLHGHNFAVVRSADSDVLNYENPVWRDTVNIGTTTSDNVTIRFETNNPGPWFMHCHIDWHLQAGFAVVMAEDVQDTASVNDPTGAWDQLCPAYNNQ